MDEKGRRKNAKQIDFQIRKAKNTKTVHKKPANKRVKADISHSSPNSAKTPRVTQVRVKPKAEQNHAANPRAQHGDVQNQALHNDAQNKTVQSRAERNDEHKNQAAKKPVLQNVKKNSDKTRNDRNRNEKMRSDEQKRRSSRAKGGMKIGGRKGNLTVIDGGKSLPKMIKRYTVLAVSIILIAAVVIFCVSRPTGIGEWMKDYFASGDEANGYPLNFSEFSANSILTANNRIFVLGESELRCYDSNGGKLFNRMHGFNSPIIRASEIRYLTFDLGGTQYRIDTVSDEIKTAKTENRIINADIADNGSYAIATVAEKEAALVTVYDMNGTETYKFRSAQRQLTKLVISPNGKKIAVCTVSAENSVMSSKIIVYSTDKSEPIYSESFDDEAIFAMKFDGNSRLCAVGSKRLFGTDFEEKQEYQFSNSSPEKVQFTDDGDVLICLANASNSSQHTVKLFDGKAEELKSFDITGTVNAMSAGDEIYILSNTLDKYTYDGEKTESADIQAGVSGIGSAFGKAVLLYPTGITLI